MPHAAFLWFEYWVAIGRRTALERSAVMLDKMHAPMTEALVLPLPGHSRRWWRACGVAALWSAGTAFRMVIV